LPQGRARPDRADAAGVNLSATARAHHRRMDITQIGLFSLAEKRLAWADQRQQVLAQNVANADTPGYRAKDVAPFAKMVAASGSTASTPVQTNPLHLAGTLPSGAARLDAMAKPDAKAPDGNAVSLQDELTKVADTDNTQQFVLNLYHTYMGMFSTALGKG
jgi:flagellar basal-body rod protein FlgB